MGGTLAGPELVVSKTIPAPTRPCGAIGVKFHRNCYAHPVRHLTATRQDYSRWYLRFNPLGTEPENSRRRTNELSKGGRKVTWRRKQ